MPNADVIIEATFKKETIIDKISESIENPKTGTKETLLLTIFTMLIICGIIGLTLIKRKIKILQ